MGVGWRGRLRASAYRWGRPCNSMGGMGHVHASQGHICTWHAGTGIQHARAAPHWTLPSGPHCINPPFLHHSVPNYMSCHSWADREDAERAIRMLNGHGYDNLILRVEWAAPRENR